MNFFASNNSVKRIESVFVLTVPSFPDHIDFRKNNVLFCVRLHFATTNADKYSIIIYG